MTGMGIAMRPAHNRLAPIPEGSHRMRHRDDDGSGRDDEELDLEDDEGGDRSSRHRHRHRHGVERRPPLTPEQRALAEARRRANVRIGFISHALAYGGVCIFLLLVAGFKTALIVARPWGIGLASHFFGALVAPDLRRRYVEREVARQVQHTAPRERRNLEERHVRSLEELSASIAHEIRNPITAAKSLVQQMGEDPASQENVEYAKVALEELDRVERSVAHLLRFAREEEIRMAEMSLPDVISSAVAALRDRASARGVTLELELGRHGSLRGDAEKLRRVLINLVSNSLDAFEGAGAAVASPRIQISSGENLAGTECWVRVSDNGPGISQDALARIFSPFYTSKERGTGLGLAISKKVVDAHGGSIEVQSALGAGAEFTITIPKQAVRS
jgi:signal transduction histidine kinase